MKISVLMHVTTNMVNPKKEVLIHYYEYISTRMETVKK